MKKSSLFLLATLLTCGSAQASESFVCQPNPMAPGARAYLLVISKGLPTSPGLNAEALILQRTSGIADPTWNLVSGNARAWAGDTGDGKLEVRMGASAAIDWTLPANAKTCFVRLPDQHSFSISTASPTAGQGVLEIYPSLSRNPNMKQNECPMLSPPRPQIIPVVCSEY